MEADVLKALNFEMGNPTVKSFLRRFAISSQEVHEVSSISLFYVYLFMIDSIFFMLQVLIFLSFSIHRNPICKWSS